MKYYTSEHLERVMKQSVSSTETMNNLDVDPDIIKARLKLIRELADGLGIDMKIPSNKSVIIKRVLSNIY